MYLHYFLPLGWIGCGSLFQQKLESSSPKDALIVPSLDRNWPSGSVEVNEKRMDRQTTGDQTWAFSSAELKMYPHSQSQALLECPPSTSSSRDKKGCQ